MGLCRKKPIIQIIDQRGRFEVNTNGLEGRGISHPLYKTMITVAKANGAVDWFNVLHLEVTSSVVIAHITIIFSLASCYIKMVLIQQTTFTRKS